MNSEGLIDRKKMLIRMRFKACVRRVIENRYWLELEDKDYKKKEGDALRTQLDFNTRVAMHKKPENRTSEDLAMIAKLMTEIADLQRFINIDFLSIARYVEHRIVRNRLIMRQGHPAEALYAILTGDVDVSVEAIVVHMMSETSKTQLHAGAMFGEFGVLYNKPRAVSITAWGNVELMVFGRELFDKYMRYACSVHYSVVTQSVAYFKHFEKYSQRDITEICFHGRVAEYKSGEIIYSSQNIREVTFFVIEGTCDLIEMLLIKRTTDQSGKEVFREFDPNSSTVTTRPSRCPGSISTQPRLIQELNEKVKKSITQPRKYHPFSRRQWNTRMQSVSTLTSQESGSIKSIRLSLSNKSYVFTVDEMPQPSTLMQERPKTRESRRSSAGRKSKPGFPEEYQFAYTYKQTHEGRKLLRRVVAQGSETIVPTEIEGAFQSVYDTHRFEAHLMTIGTFSKNACFNIGENMTHRYIVATSDMMLLEIPQKVLARRRYIIWEQVRRTLDKYIPNSITVFSNFVKERMYRAWKQELLGKLLTPEEKYRSRNLIHNVPYSIRIRNDFQFTDYYKQI